MVETLAVKVFQVPGEMGLGYSLYYVSGRGWYDNLGYWLDTTCGSTGLAAGGSPTPDSIGPPPPIIKPCKQITYHRPDGSSIVFTGTPGTIGSYPEVGGGGLATLVENGNYTYTLHDENATTLVFNRTGLLQSITDASGIGWTLSSAFNSTTGVVTQTVTRTDGTSFTLAKHSTTTNGITTTDVTVTDPAGNAYSYVMERVAGGGRLLHPSPFELTSLTYPGTLATTITYTYASPLALDTPILMTEVAYNGNSYFYVTYDSAGRANGTHDADGSEDYSIVYTIGSGGATLTAKVTNPLGHTATEQYDSMDGSEFLLTSVSNDAVQDCGATTRSLTYDSNGT